MHELRRDERVQLIHPEDGHGDMTHISEVVSGEREGGWVIEIPCTECEETEKFTMIGWTGPERVYAAVCSDCARTEEPIATAR